MSYTLVVIDIQPTFMYSAKFVLRTIQQEMEQAMQDFAPIVLVEYKDQGATLLNHVVATYPFVHWVIKTADGGGAEVDACVQNNHLPTRLRVCGVNTAACVVATVAGIRSSSHIEILDRCCWSDKLHHHIRGIDWLAAQKNVHIVDYSTIPRLEDGVR